MHASTRCGRKKKNCNSIGTRIKWPCRAQHGAVGRGLGYGAVMTPLCRVQTAFRNNGAFVSDCHRKGLFMRTCEGRRARVGQVATDTTKNKYPAASVCKRECLVCGDGKKKKKRNTNRRKDRKGLIITSRLYAVYTYVCACVSINFELRFPRRIFEFRGRKNRSEISSRFSKRTVYHEDYADATRV